MFNNRVGHEVDARFVLSSDPPGTSSVGTDFHVQLFGGPEGTPLNQLTPLEPPSTTFRGAAGSTEAGYVVGLTPVVPNVPTGGVASILLRVFDGPRWDTATYRFEESWSVHLARFPNLALGNSPLVLYPIPEPKSLLLTLTGAGTLLFLSYRPARLLRVGGGVGSESRLDKPKTFGSLKKSVGKRGLWELAKHMI